MTACNSHGRATAGMDACDEDPESQFTLKRRVGSVGCTLTCGRLLGALDVQLPDNLRVVFSSSSGSVNVQGAKFEGVQLSSLQHRSVLNYVRNAVRFTVVLDLLPRELTFLHPNRK